MTSRDVAPFLWITSNIFALNEHKPRLTTGIVNFLFKNMEKYQHRKQFVVYLGWFVMSSNGRCQQINVEIKFSYFQ